MIAGDEQVKTVVMDVRDNPLSEHGLGGVLDWWRDAGVDVAFSDTPRVWTSREAGEDKTDSVPEASGRPDHSAQGTREPSPSAKAAGRPAPPADPGLDPASLPATLADFTAWWLESPLVEVGGTGARFAPRGPAQAPLMIVVEAPEPEDTDTLLGGPQGQLLDAMLAAFGYDRSQVYLASVLPRHVPAPDWPAIAARGFGQILSHHVALAAPRRLIVLGGSILSLIGHELPQYSAVLRLFKHEDKTIPLLAAWGLPALARQPRRKATLWRAWLEWVGPERTEAGPGTEV